MKLFKTFEYGFGGTQFIFAPSLPKAKEIAKERNLQRGRLTHATPEEAIEYISKLLTNWVVSGFLHFGELYHRKLKEEYPHELGGFYEYITGDIATCIEERDMKHAKDAGNRWESYFKACIKDRFGEPNGR